MKVDDYILTIEEVRFSSDAIHDLVVRRDKRFKEFAGIEENNGFVRPSVSFSTSQGQEMLRIMLFRVLEEVVESSESEAQLHIQEELIDALNYFMSAVMLDDLFFTVNKMAELTYGTILNHRTWREPGDIEPPGYYSISKIAELVAGRMAETFRNRAWMHQTQQSFFHGYRNAAECYVDFLSFVLDYFTGWEEFHRLFVAKDMVLQFRLESKY